jgi:hypothetical protein
MIRHLVVLFLAFFTVHSTTVFADDAPANDTPELGGLSNYIGTFDVAIVSGESPFTKGDSAAKWILDGRFVQQTGKLTSEDGTMVLKITTLMTYDKAENVYRMWSFLSDGTTSESSGRWDAKTRTLTSIRRGGGSTTTTTAKFVENGDEEWLMVTKDQNNQVVDKLGGINTRCKK